MSNVPKLRFKEFSGEWSKNKTNIKIVSGNTYPLDAYSKEGTLLVQGLNIYPNELQLDNPIYISDSYITGKDVFVNKEDILLGLNRPIIGKKLKACLFRKDRAVLYQRAGILDFDKSKLSNRFLFQYLFTPSFLKQLLAELVGSDQPYIKSDLFKVTKNLFPSKQEQEKIASFLTSIDSKIEQLTKKESLLQEYKKGVMQKIFNQEIRFKDDDGSEFCEWEEKKLGDILDYIQPTKYLVKDTEYNDRYTIPVLTAGKTFILGYTNETDGVFENNLPVIIFDDFTTANKFVNFPFKAKSSAMKILTPKDNNNIKFIYEAMQMIKYEVGGHERHWISKFSFLNIFIPYIEEQIKIANFLSSIDTKIEQTQKQLESSKEFKKALLQQMFV